MAAAGRQNGTFIVDGLYDESQALRARGCCLVAGAGRVMGSMHREVALYRRQVPFAQIPRNVGEEVIGFLKLDPLGRVLTR